MNNNEYTEEEVQAYMQKLEQINKNNRFNTHTEVLDYIQGELSELRNLNYTKYRQLDNIKNLYITGLEMLQQSPESLEIIVKTLSMLEDGILKKINMISRVGTSQPGINIIGLLKQNARYYANRCD